MAVIGSFVKTDMVNVEPGATVTDAARAMAQNLQG